jgi:hypothetical protein
MTKKAFYVNEFNKNREGRYVLCIAFDDSDGLYATDLPAGDTLEEAEQFCRVKNRELGLTEEEVTQITRKVTL